MGALKESTSKLDKLMVEFLSLCWKHLQKFSGKPWDIELSMMEWQRLSLIHMSPSHTW